VSVGNMMQKLSPDGRRPATYAFVFLLLFLRVLDIQRKEHMDEDLGAYSGMYPC
jgi:hypothetical protein